MKKTSVNSVQKANSENEDSIVAPAIQWRIEQWFKNLSTEQKINLKKYHGELCKFNKALNLVSPKTIFVSDAVHFADSIQASHLVFEKINKNNSLYDIGSGNGFPGLVFSVLYPDQKVTLIDSDQRKCEFLKQTIFSMGLKNIVVENVNVEKLADGSIQQAITRGFAPLPRAMMILKKVVSAGGRVYHLKSEEWSAEISQIPSQLCSVWQPQLLGQYVVQTLPQKMYVVQTEKIC